MKRHPSDVGAIILAGGQSSRMGHEKGLVSFCGKPMIQWVLEAVGPLAHEILVVANHAGYAEFGYAVAKDDFKELGPLGGLCTGLKRMKSPINFVLGCDMPCLSTDLLQELRDALGEGAAVAAQTQERKQPMVSIYRKACLPILLEQLIAGRLRMDGALSAAGGTYHTFPGAMTDFDPNCLRNFNSPADIADFGCP
jgi:molybdopterin-guanine dinucleotide biosynthesis protein A